MNNFPVLPTPHYNFEVEFEKRSEKSRVLFNGRQDGALRKHIEQLKEQLTNVKESREMLMWIMKRELMKIVTSSEEIEQKEAELSDQMKQQIEDIEFELGRRRMLQYSTGARKEYFALYYAEKKSRDRQYKATSAMNSFLEDDELSSHGVSKIEITEQQRKEKRKPGRKTESIEEQVERINREIHGEDVEDEVDRINRELFGDTEEESPLQE